MSKENMNELIEKLKTAKSDVERKQIIESSKSELSDDELSMVSGGARQETSCRRECPWY